MGKSIAEYLNEGAGTGPAAGKMFTLYGMEIGLFMGANINELSAFTFIHPTNGRMDIPINTSMPIPVVVNGKEVVGPIINPVLSDVIQKD